MTRWIGAGDRHEWTGLFTGYQESAYRLECQQVYGSDGQDENLAQFLSGRPVEIDWNGFDRSTRAQVDAGRTKTKVRIVVEPATPYTRLELTLYPRMAAAGEDIRIIEVSQGNWPAELPHHDYWLFDDRNLWRLHYHENFRFKGAELLDDPDVVTEHLRWRDLALCQAVPLDDYLASRRTDDQERTPA